MEEVSGKCFLLYFVGMFLNGVKLLGVRALSFRFSGICGLLRVSRVWGLYECREGSSLFSGYGSLSGFCVCCI